MTWIWLHIEIEKFCIKVLDMWTTHVIIWVCHIVLFEIPVHSAEFNFIFISVSDPNNFTRVKMYFVVASMTHGFNKFTYIMFTLLNINAYTYRYVCIYTYNRVQTCKHKTRMTKILS